MILNSNLLGSSLSLVQMPALTPLAGQRAIQFAHVDTVGKVRSPFSGASQVQQWLGAEEFQAQVTMVPMRPKVAAPWIAFLLQLRGISNAFLLGDPLMQLPAGSPSGSPVGGGNGQWTCPAGVTSIVVVMATNNATINSGQSLTISDVFFGVAGSSTNLITSIADPYTVVGTGSPSGTLTSDSNTITVTPGVTYSFYGTIDASQVTGGYWPYIGVFNTALSTIYGQISPTSAVLGICGTPNLSGLSQLVTSGWPASKYRLLLPGDYIQLGYRLYRNLDQVSSDSSGNATLNIWPSIRELVPAGTPLQFANTQGLFRRADNSQAWSSDAETGLISISFKAVEFRQVVG